MMWLRPFCPIAIFGLAASAGLGQAQTAPTKADFIGVMEQQAGCFMAEADADAVLIPLGFSKDAVQDWVDELVDDGLAKIDEAGLTLKTEKCD
jgi:hypothetical protein